MISFDLWPIWAIFLATLGLILGALEIGCRLGRSRQRHAGGKADGAGAMVGATMGLLSFMLAFTFNSAAARHDARKMLVVDEANAIEQTWLRAAFLPEAARVKARATLREYLDLRVKAAAGQTAIESGVQQAGKLLDQLWAAAEEASRSDVSPIPTSQFVESANHVIDLHLRRLTIGVRTRVPPTIWFTLYLLTCLGMLMMGISTGLGSARQSGVELGLAIAFSAVLFVIADLDRPQEGLINVSQQALTDLQTKLDAR